MAEKTRFALVIGNSHYGNEKPVSGVEDAKAMVACLRELEFDVPEPILDATLENMTTALRDFEEKIKSSEATVVLFYYAGHGFQLGRQNFLLPTDGDITPDLSVPVDDVLQVLGSASSALKFAFLDACRDERQGDHIGLAEPGPAPPRLLQAFATSPGQLAASGSDDQLSLYTMALLRYLREPGLELVELFDRVRADVLHDSSFRKQHPTVAGAIPTDFYFRPPVFVHARTPGWPHKPLLLFHKDKLALATEREPATDLRLTAGNNNLLLMVSNGNNNHNGQAWGRPEGWSYQLDLDLPKGKVETFKDDEAVPFRDGPHHGKTFIVGRANLFVNPGTAEVSVLDKDDKVARREIPVWAQENEILFQDKLANLRITGDDILGGGVGSGLVGLLRPFLNRFLTTGMILDTLVVDPDDVFVVVRGNKKLRDVARFCMIEGRADRLRNLRDSFAAFLNLRHPRPFDLFVDGLNKSIQEKALELGVELAPEDQRVFVSLDDLSPEEPAVEAPVAVARVVAAAAAGAPAVEVLAEETLRDMAQDTIFHPRPDEMMIETRTIEQNVQGVPLRAQLYTFISLQPVDSLIRVNVRAVADLSDFQNKIGPLIDTFPLPTDNCSRFGLDNIVARAWGKQITIGDNGATLKLNGNVEVWTCVKNVPCSKIEWDGWSPRIVTWDCRPPIKNRNLSQSFEALLPFSVAKVDAQSFGLKLGTPSIDLGGPLGEVTEGILKIAGVDINAEAKKALDRAINPGSLTQRLPDILIPYNPTLTRAELLNNSGMLALALEAEATLTGEQFGELIVLLENRS